MKGTPAMIEKEVERIMTIGKQGTGYMFDLGEMTPRDVPVENMTVMMRQARGLSFLKP